MRIQKEMKQFTLHGLGRVKADAISSAVIYLKERKHVIPGDWCGHWDGMQWSSRKVFMHPEDLKENIDALEHHFNVKVVEFE